MLNFGVKGMRVPKVGKDFLQKRIDTMASNGYSYEKVNIFVFYKRQPNAWEDKKDYSIDHLLDDLQIYRIVSGQINSEDYHSMLESMGWDIDSFSRLVFTAFVYMICQTDDEKMGFIAKRLNRDDGKHKYFATSSSSIQLQQAQISQYRCKA